MDLTKESYQQIIANLSDGVYIVDKQRRILFWNQAAERISGYSAEQVVGTSCSDNVLCHVDEGGNHLCSGVCPIAVPLDQKISHKVTVYMHHKDGHRLPVLVCVNPLLDMNGEIIGAVEVFSDISSKVATDQRLMELEKISMLDQLTQLANRLYLERELQARLDESERYGSPFGLFFMDVDNFKAVNDTYGHDTGDVVLKFVAATLTTNSRPYDLYGRWGGEEFIGVARNVTPNELEQIGERLCRLVAESFVCDADGNRIQVTISVGATMVSENDTISTLVQRADALMYQSKAQGKNRLTVG